MTALLNYWLLHDYILPALDILLLAYLIYRIYRILEQTRAVQLIQGALFMGLIYLVAFFLRLDTLRWVLNLLVPGLVIGMAIIFQPELRRIFIHIGQETWFRLRPRAHTRQLEEVLKAVGMLASGRRGCLIVFTRNIGLNTVIETGTRLDAEVSTSLLLTIFGHNTPLHDGAVVISEGRLVAAACLLPLSDRPDVRLSYGTRHRAALGLVEETDAVVLVVSEETGIVSLAHDSNLHYDLSPEELSRRLKGLLEMGAQGQEGGTLEA
jgi:diadenylate cyclase